MVKNWSSMLLAAALMLASCRAISQGEERFMVGGYGLADLNDERVSSAAVFAVDEMILRSTEIPLAYSFSLLGNDSSIKSSKSSKGSKSSKSSKGSKSSKSGKSSKISSSSSDKKISADDFRVDIVEAEQQVVAGMNYKLTIQVSEREGGCIGAFEVVVYNHFGDLSVTTWGNEVACHDNTTTTQKIVELHEMKDIDDLDSGM